MTLDLKISEISLDKLEDDSETPFLQMSFWGKYKASFEWSARSFQLELPESGIKGQLLVLSRGIVRGFRFAYVPHGPSDGFTSRCAGILGQTKGQVLKCIAHALKPFFGSTLVFVRWDLNWIIDRRPAFSKTETESATDSAQALPAAGISARDMLDMSPLDRAGSDVQPPDTVLINLADGSESVLAGMKPKTRYNVRLAEKKGVTVVSAGLDALSAWYGLYQETAERDRIAVHSETYYRTLLEQNPERTELLLAYHEGDLLAGIIMMYAGQRATYLYGASANLKRNLMPAYLLQWVGIQHAVERGCRSYDCFGIPPSSSPGHPMHGLYQFKTGLGGEIVAYPGCWDAPTRPILYRLYQLAEKLRYYYFKKLKKR